MKQPLSFLLFGCFCVVGCNKPDDRVVNTAPVRFNDFADKKDQETGMVGSNVVGDTKGQDKKPVDSKANDTIEKAVPAATPFLKSPPKFASVSVKASFLPIAMGKKALTEAEVNEAFHKIAQGGIHAIRKDEKGRIASLIVVGQAGMQGTVKEREFAHLRARLDALSKLLSWLGEDVEYKEAGKGKDSKSRGQYTNIPAPQLLHAETDDKEQVYTLFLGYDAKAPLSGIKAGTQVQFIDSDNLDDYDFRKMITCILPEGTFTSVFDPEFTIGRNKGGDYSLTRLTFVGGGALQFQEYKKQGVIEQATEHISQFRSNLLGGKVGKIEIEGANQADIARKWDSVRKGQMPKEGVAIVGIDSRQVTLNTITNEQFNEFATLVKTKVGLDLRLENLK